MNSDLYHCEACSALFDKTTHIPKVIPVCGHTLCSACLDRIVADTKKCPFDNSDFPKESNSTINFTNNLIILQLIDKKLQSEYGTCDIHKQPRNMVCVVDCQQICEKCALEHKGHTIKSVDEVRMQAEIKKKRLEEILVEFENQQDEIAVLLRDSKKTILTNLAHDFAKINDMIKQKEKAAILEVESWFEDQKTIINQAIEGDIHVKKKCEVKISDLENHMNIRFFNTVKYLEKSFPSFHIRVQLNKITRDLEVVSKQYTSTMETLNNSLTSIIGNTTFYFSEINPEANSEADKCDLRDNLWHLLKIQFEENSIEISPITTKIINHEQTEIPNLSLIKEKKQVHLKFNKNGITQQHFQALNELDSYCANMTELHLYFNNREFTDRDLTDFCSTNTWIRDKVQSFYLDCEHSKISDKSMIGLVENVLAKMEKINGISLCLDHTKITDKSISALASKVIQKVPKLSSFYLDVNSTKITSSSITELCKQMRRISTNIKSFRLGLNMTEINDQVLVSLSSIIPTANLEVLELFLFKSKITDQGFENFCKTARQSLENTKIFCLDVGDTKVNDKSISTLGNYTLSNMSRLEEINLCLSRTQITDLSFQSIFEHLDKSIQSLKTLNFNFTMTKLTDTSFNYFAKRISQMKCLKTFLVDISNTKVTDTSIQRLCEGLKPIFKNIETFELCIYGTEVTQNGLAMLVDFVDLASATALYVFRIRYSESLVTEEIKKKLSLIQKGLSLKSEEFESQKSDKICPGK